MITRRSLMALAALATTAGCDDCETTASPTAPLGSVGAQGSGTKAQVIVIGAGVAGLVAAHELREAGLSVIVLEGRDRAGGRIWTDRTLGAPFDLGASWIHGVQDNPLTKLARERGIKTVASDYGEVHLYGADGKAIADGDTEEILGEWTALQSEVERRAETLDADISVAEGIRRAIAGERLDPDEKRALDWVVATQEVAAATDLGHLSLLHGDDDDELSGGDRLFPAGYDQVVRAVGSEVDVRLSHRVSRVVHGAGDVTVETDHGAFSGERLLVTVPLGVLKRGGIQFVPGLPKAKTAAIARLGMGVLNKVVLKFDKAFWPTDRDFLGYAGAIKGEFPVFMNCRKFSDSNALIAFTGGSFARSLENLKPRAAAERAMTVLRRMYGSKVGALEGHLVARWGSDPFAFGSYSHVAVGATGKDFDALAQPIGERVFFAGEATHRQFPGTVHGALLSGRREAKRIAAL